jgi:hypothetical protein
MFDENRLNWPARRDINEWADYVETLCILSDDGIMSVEDFTDFLFDDATRETEQILTAVNFNDHFLTTLPDIPVAQIAPQPPNEQDEENEFDGEDEESDNKEKVRSKLLTLFSFLQCRSVYFGEDYPFTISGIDLTIELIPTAEQTLLNKLYQVLLFSSEMNLYSHAVINRLGHLFEALCQRPFSQLIPAISEKRYFGAGAGEILPRGYEGNLKSRLKLLAQDLASKTKEIINDPDEIAYTGDAGLDWVGWVSFEDHCNHQPIYFGQCACGANWVDKQHETSLSHWNNFLDLNQSVQCFHFMPRSFRRTSLKWYQETAIIYGLIVVDRYRLLKMFGLEGNEEIQQVLHLYADILQAANDFSLS